MARKTIGANPLDAVIPPQPAEPAEEPVSEPKLRVTLHLARETASKLRAAVYWTPGETLASLVGRAVLAEVKRMEKERGEPFPSPGKLRTGRPPAF